MTDLLSDASRFLQEGQNLRARLQKEREELAARIEQIDGLLSQLPRTKVNTSPDEDEEYPDLADEANASIVVREILAYAGGPVRANEVIRLAKRFGSEIEDANLHAALSRLARENQIGRSGERGSFEFFLRGEK